jgi:hypothetical protein
VLFWNDDDWKEQLSTNDLKENLNPMPDESYGTDDESDKANDESAHQTHPNFAVHSSRNEKYEFREAISGAIFDRVS